MEHKFQELEFMELDFQKEKKINYFDFYFILGNKALSISLLHY